MPQPINPNLQRITMSEQNSPIPIVPQPCALCGGEMVKVEIANNNDARVSLVGESAGRFVSRDALVPLERAHVCIQCGHTQLFADPEKVRRRILSRFPAR